MTCFVIREESDLLRIWHKDSAHLRMKGTGEKHDIFAIYLFLYNLQISITVRLAILLVLYKTFSVYHL